MSNKYWIGSLVFWAFLIFIQIVVGMPVHLFFWLLPFAPLIISVAIVAAIFAFMAVAMIVWLIVMGIMMFVLWIAEAFGR